MNYPTDFSTLDYVSPGHADYGIYFFWSVFVLGFGVLACLVAMGRRARTLAAAQANENALQHQKGVPLSAGPDRVVRGTVVSEGTGVSPVAVEVRITQLAQNHTNKNNRWHTWKETARSVVARPFELLTEDGERVHVEPGERVLVADGLETQIPNPQGMNRFRQCDVKHGEVFCAYGDLHNLAQGAEGASPYRAGQLGWVLRPSRSSGGMLLANDSIEERYVPRIALLRFWTKVFLVLWIGMHAAATVPFVVTSLAGKNARATVESTRTYITRNKNSTTRHYVVNARTADGVPIEGEVVSSTWNRIETARTQDKQEVVIPVFVGPPPFPSYLGTQPHGAAAILIFASIGWSVVFLIVWSAHQSRRAWYDKEKLEEHGGKGHWPSLK